jgi:hypothetical protein
VDVFILRGRIHPVSHLHLLRHPGSGLYSFSTPSEMSNGGADSLMDKLGDLKQFDAFPKLPSTYRARSESRGLLTIFVSFVAFLLVLNDIGEFIWGWPDYEFSVDRETGNTMKLNVDMIINMPCQCMYTTCFSGLRALLTDSPVEKTLLLIYVTQLVTGCS